MSALAMIRREYRSGASVRTPNARRVMRVAVATVGLHRGITLTTVLAAGAGVTALSMAIAYAAVVVWSGVLLWDGWRRGRFRPGLATVDVVVASTVAMIALSWSEPGMSFGYGLLQGAALVAGCSLRVVALAAAAMPALIAASAVVAVTHAPSLGVPVAAEALTYAGTLAVLALAACVGNRLLRTAADAFEQRRVLHDTALATLTAIGTGVLDPRSDDVRARAARDAAYLRLVLHGGPISPDSLPVALAAAAQEATTAGLRVHAMRAALGTDLDPAVVRAISLAVREALNNVRLHASVAHAWLTAAEEDGTVVVRIVDRGVGFEPSNATDGTGLHDSIQARMSEVRGTGLVQSAPGEGTCVELRWPA